MLDSESNVAVCTSFSAEERKQKQYEDQVETWRKETDIKVDKKEWKKVDFEDQGVNVKQTTTDSEK